MSDHRSKKGLSNSMLSALYREMNGEPPWPESKAFGFGAEFHRAVLEPYKIPEIQLKPAERILCDNMAFSARSHPLFRRWTNGITKFEVSKTKEWLGHPWKAKCDIEMANAIVDLKSISVKNRTEVEWAIKQYRWDVQAFIYRMIFGVPKFFIFGVSKFKPHPCWVIDMTERIQRDKDEIIAYILRGIAYFENEYKSDFNLYMKRHGKL